MTESDAETYESDSECKFCFINERSNSNPLLSPCKCSGSLTYVHRKCLSTWMTHKMKDNLSPECEICHQFYDLEFKNVFEKKISTSNSTQIYIFWVFGNTVLLWHQISFVGMKFVNPEIDYFHVLYVLQSFLNLIFFILFYNVGFSNLHDTSRFLSYLINEDFFLFLSFQLSLLYISYFFGFIGSISQFAFLIKSVSGYNEIIKKMNIDAIL